MYIVKFLYKLACFFLVAYIFSLLEALYLRLSKEEPQLKISLSPLNYLPFWEAIVLPILTLFFLDFPIGFPRDIRFSFQTQLNRYSAKIFALAFLLALSCILLFTAFCFPRINSLTMGLYGYFSFINLVFIIYSIFPFYPTAGGYTFLALIQKPVIERRGLEEGYRVLLSFKYFTSLLLFVCLTPPFFFFLIKKINFFSRKLIKIDSLYYLLTSVVILLILTLWIIISRKNLKQYHKDLKEAMKQLFSKGENEL